MSNTLSLRHRLGNAYVGLLYRVEGIRYDLGFWKQEGGAVPHAVKRRIIRDYARRFGLRSLVETGTHVGHMVAAMLRSFDQIHSIELGRDLFERASARFRNRRSVHLHCGDSASALPQILAALPGPALFWLDAHYSGGVTARADVDTPIVAELEIVLGRDNRPHVILIDDARCFCGKDGYPTIDGVKELVAKLRPDYDVTVAQDVIRATPGGRT